jgi:hypothetical protein
LPPLAVVPRFPLARLRSALLLLPLAACGFDVAGSAPMEAPALYREWWAKTESCSGLRGDFDRIEWQIVPGYSFECNSGQCAGHWQRGHQIYLAEEWKMNEMVVRHEMLHDLMNGGGHPNPPFGQGCPLTWETWRNGAELRFDRMPRLD